MVKVRGCSYKLSVPVARTDLPLYLHRVFMVLTAGGRMFALVSSCSGRQQATLSVIAGTASQRLRRHGTHALFNSLSHRNKHALCLWWPKQICVSSSLVEKKKRRVTQYSQTPRKPLPLPAALLPYTSFLPGEGASKFILSILPGGCSYAALFTVAES